MRMKTIFTAITFLLAVGIAPTAIGAEKGQTGDAPRQVELEWLGGATLAIRFDGRTYLTDPALGEGERAFRMGDPNEKFDLSKGPNIKYWRRRQDLPEFDIETVDRVVLSHIHEDHFDQQAVAQLPKASAMIAPPHDKKMLDGFGFAAVRYMRWGAEFVDRTEHGQVRIVALPAEHSKDHHVAELLGEGNGYWFEFTIGDWTKTVYWTGDTFPTKRVLEAVQKLGKPDILVPHVGSVGVHGTLGQISMNADDVIELVNSVSPERVLPIHHSTFDLYIEAIAQLAFKFEDQTTALDLVDPGARILYD